MTRTRPHLLDVATAPDAYSARLTSQNLQIRVNKMPSPKSSCRNLPRNSKKYFGTATVSRISTDAVLAYIAERKQAGTSNGTINRDLDVLRGVLKRAKRWHLMAEDIRPLNASQCWESPCSPRKTPFAETRCPQPRMAECP